MNTKNILNKMKDSFNNVHMFFQSSVIFQNQPITIQKTLTMINTIIPRIEKIEQENKNKEEQLNFYKNKIDQKIHDVEIKNNEIENMNNEMKLEINKTGTTMKQVQQPLTTELEKFEDFGML